LGIWKYQYSQNGFSTVMAAVRFRAFVPEGKHSMAAARGRRKKGGIRGSRPIVRAVAPGRQSDFSSISVGPRGTRIESMKSCISLEGAGVIRLTIQAAAKPVGMPNRPAEMLETPNQVGMPK